MTSINTSTKLVQKWHESTQLRLAAMSRRRRFIICFVFGAVLSPIMNFVFFHKTDDIIPDIIIIGLVIGLMQAFAPELFGNPRKTAGHQ